MLGVDWTFQSRQQAQFQNQGGNPMKKSECEKNIRLLCQEWARGFSAAQSDHPSFLAFKAWLKKNGYEHHLNFRSVMGADHDAEMWFDEELKQNLAQARHLFSRIASQALQKGSAAFVTSCGKGPTTSHHRSDRASSM
jgi:hypothetical protein